MSFHYQMGNDAITMFQLQTKQKHWWLNVHHHVNTGESLMVFQSEGSSILVVSGSWQHVTPGKTWGKLRSYCEYCYRCVLRRAFFFVYAYQVLWHEDGIGTLKSLLRRNLGFLGQDLFNLIVFLVVFSVVSTTPQNTPPKTEGWKQPMLLG